MIMTKREIYYIIFNKHLKPDGRFEADNYQLEIESSFQGKVPESIKIESGKVIVTFTDKDRHIFPLDNNCEYFDREIKPKLKDDENKTT